MATDVPVLNRLIAFVQSSWVTTSTSSIVDAQSTKKNGIVVMKQAPMGICG